MQTKQPNEHFWNLLLLKNIIFLFIFSARICSTLPAALVRQGIVGRGTFISERQVMMQREGEDRLDHLRKGVSSRVKLWEDKKEAMLYYYI